MSLKEKALKGVFWSAVQKWVQQGTSFIVFIVLARLLGPEAFGLVALATIFLTFIQMFLDQGFAEAIVQRETVEPEHLDTAFWVSLGISIFLTGICIASAGFVAGFFKEPGITPIVRWLSLSFVLKGLNSVQGAILQRNLDFKSLATRTIGGMWVGAAVGLGMAWAGCGVWSLVGQQLSNLVVGIPLLWALSDWRPRFRVSKKHFHELFSFGINLMAFNVLNFFNRRSDNLLIGYFLGSVALGYYNVAYRIIQIMTDIIANVTTQVALPAFSRMQQEPERLRNAFYKVTQITSLISFPAFIGVAVLTPELVSVMFGKEWLACIPVMRVLAFVGILQTLFYFNSTVLLAMGKTDWRLWLNVVSSITNVIAFAVTVQWGIVAVAMAYTIRGYLFSPLPLVVIRKLIDLNLITYLRQYFAPFGGSVAMAAAMFGTRHFLSDLLLPQVVLAISVVIGIVVYLIVLQLLAPKLIRKTLDLVFLALPKLKWKKSNN